MGSNTNRLRSTVMSFSKANITSTISAPRLNLITKSSAGFQNLRLSSTGAGLMIHTPTTISWSRRRGHISLRVRIPTRFYLVRWLMRSGLEAGMGGENGEFVLLMETSGRPALRGIGGTLFAAPVGCRRTGGPCSAAPGVAHPKC